MDEFEERIEELRPYCDDEVPGVIARLLHDDEFLDFLARYDSPRLSRAFPALVRPLARYRLSKLIGTISSIRDFQLIVEKYARKIVNDTMTSFEHSGLESLRSGEGYVFVSNHRDIAGDSMLVDFALYAAGRETVRIAVGDNLVQRQFATDLMKLNKSFFIKRSDSGAKKVYAALSASSRYVHDSLLEGHSIWIAQREGRAKNGMDVTDPAVIKMLALAERKKPFSEVAKSLHLVPVAISYEFDPCDELKAKELNAIGRLGKYAKPAGEDLVSLARGLGGFKGRVRLRFDKPLYEDFETPEDVAAELDRRIVRNLELFPCNFLALKELAERGDDPFKEAWQRVGAIAGPVRDAVYAERRAQCPSELSREWLQMYANPILNKLKLKLPVVLQL